MLDTEAIARELGSIEKLIDLVLNLDSKIKDALWSRRARAIMERMRNLYFREKGTLGFLRRVADGEPVPADILNEVKSHFYEQEGRPNSRHRRHCLPILS